MECQYNQLAEDSSTKVDVSGLCDKPLGPFEIAIALSMSLRVLLDATLGSNPINIGFINLIGNPSNFMVDLFFIKNDTLRFDHRCKVFPKILNASYKIPPLMQTRC